MGRHCREIKISIRISDIEDESPTNVDASATWITGHNENMTFGAPYVSGDFLMVDAVAHVPCKYLRSEETGNGKPHAVCEAHGFSGPMPADSRPAQPQKLQLGGDRFSVIHRRRRRRLHLPPPEPKPRSLPVLQEDPCFEAPCRTSDNKMGAACCRDLRLEIFLPETRVWAESLLRSRKPPYLCKVERDDEDTIDAEIISACAYLNGTRQCSLHDRERPNGRPAKPELCTKWPELEDDETGHPGCRLV